jgi:hypothetical protein
VGAGAAFGYWLTSDSSNPAQTGADTLPTGAAPTVPATAPSPNSNTVVVSFAQVSTATGHVGIPAAYYSLRRYPAAGGAGVSVTATCSGTGTITCNELSVPDGKWRYTDTPTYGTNWLGTESAESPAVTVDTTPPAVGVTFPAASGEYNAASWNAMTGISGTASDATSGIPGASSINLVITRSSNGYTWNGSAFTAGSNSVDPTAFAAGTWTYTFPAANFPADGSYTVGVSATDAVGNTSATASSSFLYDNTPPGGSISYTNGYVTTTSVSVTFSASDALSGVNPASGQLERASAPLAGGTCGPFGAFAAIGPAGVTSPYTDSTVASGNCYQYEYLASDNAGNQATIASSSVLRVDTAAPSAPTLAYSGLTNAFASGGTVYYRAAATSGSFTVTASSTDPVSGISTYTFPTLGPGWRAAGSGASRTYSWSTANPTTAAAPFTVTATNGAGLTSSGTNASNPFTLTVDNTAPTGGSIVANGSSSTSYNITGTVPLSVTNFTDGGSGMGANTITRASGTLTNNTCGALSGSTPVTVTAGSDSSTLSTGCYQYTLTGTDNVGNMTTAMSAVVMVDTTPPALTITTSGAGIYYSGSGSTVYFSGGGAPSFTITATDPSTGIKATSFPAAPSGWTKTSGTNSATYTRSAANASSSLTSVSATNNAGATNTETVSVTLDNAAPANNVTLTNQSGGGAVLSGTTVYYQGSVSGSFTITNALADSGSGPASSGFAALTGTSTGFTFTAGAVSTPAGGPYVSATFTWSAGTTSSPQETITGTDNVGNATTTTLTFVNDTNSLTQTAPTFMGNSGHTTFHGSASSSNTVTVYYCLGTVSSCTAGTAAGSVTVAGSASWSTAFVSLAHGQAYTSQAYQSDPFGDALVSNVEQFTS